MTNIFLNDSQPIGLYIHIPFCTKKCSYCDFYSIDWNQRMADDFIEGLSKEILLYAKKYRRRVKTIFFGGGTPSLISPEQITSILGVISDFFDLEDNAEISIEANPASLTKEKIIAYNELGINRMSVGIQSFNNDELNLLGRLHNREKAENVIKNVKNIFNNYNLDLIFALPGQKVEEWQKNLKRALDFLPPHLSLYNLQIEEGTEIKKRIKNGDITPVDEKTDAAMYNLSRKILRNKGYKQYEISNFAQNDFKCRHNLIYWRYTPYLGLGPAAHSFINDCRFYNPASLKKYLYSLANSKLPYAKKEELSKEEMMSEKMFMGLRLANGVSCGEFYDRFGEKLFDIYGKEIEKLFSQNLLKLDGKRVMLTEKGLFLANQVFMEFI